jgi:SM-20-related protein
MWFNYEALKAAPVNQTPFPYFAVPNLLSEDAVKKAIADFPSIDMGGLFPLDKVAGGKVFAEIVDELRGPETAKIVGEKLGVDLGEMSTMITLRGCARHADGKIHTDSKFKKATLLLYLNDGWPHEGGRLRILRNGTDIENYVTEIPPLGGALVAFKCTENAWHGHKEYEGVRRYVMCNYVADQGALKRELNRHRISAQVKKIKRALGFGKIDA